MFLVKQALSAEVLVWAFMALMERWRQM